MKLPKFWSNRLTLIAISLIMGLSAFAQVTVNGLVLDSGHEPIIGASVFVKGTQTGTATDIDGRFSIKVPSPTSTLVISYLGCLPAEVQANDPALATGIVLRENSEVLEEVLVIGYGSVKKSDATGSVTAIKPDESNMGSKVTVQDALVGKIAGVNVVSSSGAPGSGSTVRIRSGASLSASNDPLFVIDGVPVDNSTIEGGTNILAGINPNDIETFTVLKDASATAIYGSRASNGVIVITTKRGGEHLNVSYQGNFSISHTAKRLKVLSADEFRAFVPTVTGVPADAVYGTTSTDWQDEIYRTAFGTEHNVSVSGTYRQLSSPYRVSVGYTNQDGVVKTNNYQRFSAGLAVNPQFFDKHLTFNLNVKFSYERNALVDNAVVGDALRYDPTRPVHDGAPNQPGAGYFIWKNGANPMAIQTNNPVAEINLRDEINKITRTIGNIQAIYKIHGLEDLRLNGNFGFDVLRSKYNLDVPQYSVMTYTGYKKDGTGITESGVQDKRNFLIDLYADYNHKWNQKHDFSAMVGYGWQHFWKRYNNEQYTNNSFDENGNPLTNFIPEESRSKRHYETENYLLSLYGRLNYSYDNRYLLTATLRADASSRFSKDNRWGYFPSVALAWRVIEEGFMKEQDVMSDLKIRVGYGVTGQQDIADNDYPWMTTFSVSYPESMYLFGDKWYSLYRPNGYDNDLKWETTKTWNAGFDYGFLNNRIYGSVDYYHRKTDDLINTISVAAGVNYAPVIATNIGSMKNEGIEISLNTVPVHTKDWEWNLGINYTWQTSKISKLNTIDSDQNFVNTGYISGTGKSVQVFMVDKTPYTYYLCQQAYDEAGNPIEGQYVQPDGSVSNAETKYATDKSALPKHLLGFNTQLKYRDWDLSINAHGAFGNYVYNYIRADEYLQSTYSDQGSFSNILCSTRDLAFDNQQLYSDYFLENGSFFRIDNITLGYTFRKLWNDKSNLRVTFSVNNVHTFTGYKGLDPELYSGLDREMYPRPRTFSLGLNLNF